MALLDLNTIAPHEERNRIVRILNYKRNDESNFTVYVIQVHVGDFTWTIERRFRDFSEFDGKRFKDQKRSFLPPKKLVGNADPSFLMERRSELEKYLRTVVELELWLQKKRNGFAMPRLLARFLDFHQYVCQTLVWRTVGSLIPLNPAVECVPAASLFGSHNTPLDLHLKSETDNSRQDNSRHDKFWGWRCEDFGVKY